MWEKARVREAVGVTMRELGGWDQRLKCLRLNVIPEGSDIISWDHFCSAAVITPNSQVYTLKVDSWPHRIQCRCPWLDGSFGSQRSDSGTQDFSVWWLLESPLTRSFHPALRYSIFHGCCNLLHVKEDRKHGGSPGASLSTASWEWDASPLLLVQCETQWQGPSSTQRGWKCSPCSESCFPQRPCLWLEALRSSLPLSSGQEEEALSLNIWQSQVGMG